LPLYIAIGAAAYTAMTRALKTLNKERRPTHKRHIRRKNSKAQNKNPNSTTTLKRIIQSNKLSRKFLVFLRNIARAFEFEFYNREWRKEKINIV
jgi:hypothetical protein